jgi:hypothetical protein
MLVVDEEEIRSFAEWRDDIDQDHLLDVYNLALGWFSGRGWAHTQACEVAAVMQQAEESNKPAW